jgi:hypothetical protein
MSNFDEFFIALKWLTNALPGPLPDCGDEHIKIFVALLT